MLHVTCDQASTVFVQWSVSTNLFCKWRFLPCHRHHGGADSCLLPGSSFNGTRWTFLGKYHYRRRNMVFRLWSGHQTTDCKVGGAKLSKTKETAISNIASKDDVNCFFFRRRRCNSSRVCTWRAESKCKILRGCFGSATEENSTS